MSRALFKSSRFELDVALTFGWYAAESGEPLAWRFFESVDRTLTRLAQFSEMGKKRKFRHPELQGLCSFRVDPPFDDHLIFFRWSGDQIFAERLIHGSRDLARRLREPPGTGGR